MKQNAKKSCYLDMKNEKNKIKKHDLTLALDYLINGKPVKYVTGKEFQKDGIKLTEKVPEYYELFFNSYAIYSILGKKEKSAVFIAPILFGSARWACEVVVQIRPNRVGFYLHEAEEKKSSWTCSRPSLKTARHKELLDLLLHGIWLLSTIILGGKYEHTFAYL